MPTLISRDEALARITAEGGVPACLMCAILEGRVGALYTLIETKDVVALLPRYVRRWGQIQVVPKTHVTTFAEIDRAVWAETNAIAHHAACVVEKVLQPKRVFLASTGSSAGKDLVQTSAHLHVHVVPVYEIDARPAEIFTWSHGVFVAEHDEWIALRRSLLDAW